MNNSTCINVLKILATAMVFFCHSWIVCYETFNYTIHDFYRIFITPAWGGVWIFLVVGGYLAGYGFYGGKYSLTLKGVKKYYINRLVKILIPTWIFVSMGYILIYQEKTVTMPEVIQWLTCTFNGYGSLPGIGASWYVFIVMWCYLLTPFIIRFLNNLEKKSEGKEFCFYLKTLLIVCVLGGTYRVVSYFYLDWYNWTYANVLGCIDLFVAGIITFRMTFFLPNLSVGTVSLFRYVSNLGLLILILLCIDFGTLIPYGGLLYKYVWPSAYLIFVCAILVSYSFKSGVYNLKSPLLLSFCNTLAPYTFTYYLWHSFMLMYVASQLKIEDDDLHFVLTVFVGAIVSSYIAFMMTKMNTGILKALRS